MKISYFALGVKLLVLVLGATGYANMWAAVFADVGVSVIAILNAIRAMRVKKFLPRCIDTKAEIENAPLLPMMGSGAFRLLVGRTGYFK